MPNSSVREQTDYSMIELAVSGSFHGSREPTSIEVYSSNRKSGAIKSSAFQTQEEWCLRVGQKRGEGTA